MLGKKINLPLYLIFCFFCFSNYPIYSDENSDLLEKKIKVVMRQGSRKKMSVLYKELGDCYVQNKNPVKAIEAYQKALSFPFESLNVDKRLEIVRYLVSQRENRTALLEVEKILVHDPYNAESLQYKFQLNPVKNTVSAQYLEEISLAKKDNNQNKLTRLYKELGDSYLDLNKKEEAIEAYEMALARPAISLTLPERFKLADFLGEQGRYTSSIAELKKLIQADSNNLKIKIKLASFLIANKKFDEAEKYINEVLDIDPKRQEALCIKENLLKLTEKNE